MQKYAERLDAGVSLDLRKTIGLFSQPLFFLSRQLGCGPSKASRQYPLRSYPEIFPNTVRDALRLIQTKNRASHLSLP